MKVLVTGADGFIGSHLVEQLISSGHSVKALVQYNSRGDVGWISDLPPSIKTAIEVVAGDVRDSELMTRIVSDVEISYHLAALIAIPYSYVAPRSYVETNVLGTLNLLEAVRSSSGRLVVTSTSEVYGTAQYVPIDELHPIQAQSPYSASKIGADALAEAYLRSFGLPITILRPFNTFGPRQSARALIPSLVMQLLSTRDGTIFAGDLGTMRDFNFVQDIVRAFVVAGTCEKAIGSVMNVASGTERSGEQVLSEICTILNIDPQEITVKRMPERMRPEKSEVYRLLGSSKKFSSLCDWREEIGFSAGLSLTVDWFKNRHVEQNSSPERFIL